MVRNIILKTNHLHLPSKDKLSKEIMAQGIEKIIEHIKWSGYTCFCFQEHKGRVLELYKYGENYMSRDSEDFFNPVSESFAISKIRGALVRI